MRAREGEREKGGLAEYAHGATKTLRIAKTWRVGREGRREEEELFNHCKRRSPPRADAAEDPKPETRNPKP